MELSLFDLHCDTALEMLRQKQSLTKNDLAVSLEKASAFRRYIQVMALWIPRSLTDSDGWQFCLDMLNNLRADPAVTSGRAPIRTQISTQEAITLLLSLEDARILDGSLERLDTLHTVGVRIVTPFWKGNTCIGGSHDTELGLTPFGEKALNHAIDLGMILDISHASERSADEIFAIAQKRSVPVIASHSNAYTVCPVSRNLRDAQICAILNSGGVIGLNLYQSFLTTKPQVYAKDLLPHVEHFLSLGAADALCLGCDMDGALLPPDLSDLSALPYLAELLLQQNYSETLVNAIFFENACRFTQKHLK